VKRFPPGPSGDGPIPTDRARADGCLRLVEGRHRPLEHVRTVPPLIQSGGGDDHGRRVRPGHDAGDLTVTASSDPSVVVVDQTGTAAPAELQSCGRGPRRHVSAPLPAFERKAERRPPLRSLVPLLRGDVEVGVIVAALVHGHTEARKVPADAPERRGVGERGVAALNTAGMPPGGRGSRPKPAEGGDVSRRGTGDGRGGGLRRRVRASASGQDQAGGKRRAPVLAADDAGSRDGWVVVGVIGGRAPDRARLPRAGSRGSRSWQNRSSPPGPGCVAG